VWLRTDCGKLGSRGDRVLAKLGAHVTQRRLALRVATEELAGRIAVWCAHLGTRSSADGLGKARSGSHGSRMTDRTTLRPFIQNLVSHGVGPTRGLEMYRKEGGAIRTEWWFATYREIRGEHENAAGAREGPPNITDAPAAPLRTKGDQSRVRMLLHIRIFARTRLWALSVAWRFILFLLGSVGVRTGAVARWLATAARQAAGCWLPGAWRKVAGDWHLTRGAELVRRVGRRLVHTFASAVAATKPGLVAGACWLLGVLTVMRRSASALGRRLVRPRFVGFVMPVAAVVLLLLRSHSASSLYLLYIALSLVLAAVCWTTLVWMLDAWRSPDAFTDSHREAEDLEPQHSFSLIVPARHEETVLEATLLRLVATDHPAFEVLVVVGADDSETREVADRVAAARRERVRIVIDHSWPKNKPKALNTALPQCRGEITGVFDAEDDVHPGLVRRVDECFQKTGADVVQAGVQLMNFRSSWFAVRNVLEYYFWFRSRLHFHARQGFIPLGGNTVFVRTRVLRELGGWDPDCLAEDCELGVRLSSLGAQTVCFYEPELVTREETPPTLGAFTRQRTRWNQGYLQTLARGHWRRLPLRHQAFGVYILAMPYLLALGWLMIPAAIATAVAVKAPVPVTLISFLPLLPMLSVLAVEAVGLADFCRIYGEPARIRDYARLVLGLPVYQGILAFAAARAVAREALGTRSWEKTTHFGLHLRAGSDPASGSTRRKPAFALRSTDASDASAASRAEQPVAGVLAVALPGTPTKANLALRAHAGAGSDQSPNWPRHDSSAAVVEEFPPDHLTWAGNGRAGSSSRAAGSLVPHTGRQPLWVRLSVDSTDGSVALPLPNIARPDRLADAGVRWAGHVRSFLGGLLRSHTDAAIQLPLLAAVGLVMATNMFHWPGVQFDEGTYVANAWAVQNRGALAFYTYTYGHPPLAWLTISLWTWASGIFGHAPYSIDGARELMFAISILSCSLLYTLGRRLGMGRPFAAGAVILFALSPVGLFFHRGVFLDNPATAWALAAFVLALTPRRRVWAFAGSGACFAASVLSKETTLVLLPALLVAAAQNADPRTRRYCLALFASFLSLIGIAYPLYATLKGELLPGQGHVSLIGTATDMLFLRRQSGSIFAPHSVAHATIQFWLHLDPWLLGAALLLSPVALARRNTRAVALAYLIQVAMVLRPGYLPNMFVIAFLPFAALVAAGGAEVVIRFLIDRLNGGLPDRRRSHPTVLSTPVVLATLALLLGVSALVGVHVGLRWWHEDRMAMTTRLDGPPRDAGRWLIHNVGHKKLLIVTDDFWIYLIEHGFDSHPVRGGFNSRRVVSYWPLDYDPAVKRYFPRGWHEFNYIVSTYAMRVTAIYTPTTAKALKYSRVVARFGQGPQAIEIRGIMSRPQSGVTNQDRARRSRKALTSRRHGGEHMWYRVVPGRD
jgi:cellulose synthase/poly-beta-1,6-N-acetylglucosamine synthase-like glycosyltransferase